MIDFGAVVAGLFTAGGLAVSLLIARRRPTPPIPLAVVAIVTPVLAFALYLAPFSTALFVVLMLAGAAAGVGLQSVNLRPGHHLQDPVRTRFLLQVAWSAAFLWAQSAELAGSFGAFAVGIALFAFSGGLLAGYALAVRFAPMSRRALLQPAFAAASQPFTPPAWTPTHLTPTEALPAFAVADPLTAVIAQVPPSTPVELVTVVGEWAEVSAVTGWVGWVNLRRLVPYR